MNFFKILWRAFSEKTAPLLMTALSLLSFGKTALLQAECRGKVDVGPAYVRLDILESGKTVKTLDLPAIRFDGAYDIYNGFCFKPSVMYGSNDGSLFSAGFNFGQCFPVTKSLIINPGVGLNYSEVRTHINLPEFMLFKLKERFRSLAPYVSLDVSYKIGDSWRICGLVQYAWSRTRTTIQHLVKAKGHSQGPSYALYIEKDLNDQWSINLGGAYNISLSHEKHGIRGAGLKLGLARWF